MRKIKYVQLLRSGTPAGSATRLRDPYLHLLSANRLLQPTETLLTETLAHCFHRVTHGLTQHRLVYASLQYLCEAICEAIRAHQTSNFPRIYIRPEMSKSPARTPLRSGSHSAETVTTVVIADSSQRSLNGPKYTHALETYWRHTAQICCMQYGQETLLRAPSLLNKKP